MTYQIVVTNVPDGAYIEAYICGPSNGNGSPDAAKRLFRSRAKAERVVAEFYAAKEAHPENFEPDMEASIFGWQ
jgi:hypothetical protein